MALAILTLVLILFLIGWASYAIANVVHRTLVKSGNANANVFRALTAIASFIAILGTIVLLLVYNVRIER